MGIVRHIEGLVAASKGFVGRRLNEVVMSRSKFQTHPLRITFIYVRFDIYTVCLKNDTDVAHYNVNAHQLILVIFGRDVAERVCYQMVI